MEVTKAAEDALAALEKRGPDLAGIRGTDSRGLDHARRSHYAALEEARRECRVAHAAEYGERLRRERVEDSK